MGLSDGAISDGLMRSGMIAAMAGIVVFMEAETIKWRLKSLFCVCVLMAVCMLVCVSSDVGCSVSNGVNDGVCE